MTKPRVLVVDDEAGIRTVLSVTLADLDYTVCTAENGKDALTQFHAAPFPIVVTDIRMPVMDGLQLLEELRKCAPETEVIVVTGHGDMELAVQALQNRASDFITKPISDTALLVALTRAQERIALRNTLQQYTKHLETMVEEKSRALVQAERLAAAGETAASLAHSVKNMCSGLEGCMYLLEQGLQQHRYDYMEQGWKMLHSNVTRLKNLSLDMLNHAHSAAICPETCDPTDVLHRVTELLSPIAHDANILLQIHIPKSPPLAYMDTDAVERALLNIAGNALEAVLHTKKPTTPQVTLALEITPKTIMYLVHDTGAGIPLEQQPHLFTPFFTTKGLSGTGIGLSSAKRIAEQHGGFLTVTSPAGNVKEYLPAQGTLFRLSLPRL